MNIKSLIFPAFVLLLYITSCKKHSVNPYTNADVYVVGTVPEGVNGNPIAVYWKNGNLIKLPGGSTQSYASAMTIQDNDIYIAGYIDHTPNGRGEIEAVYWKNGIMYKLGSDTANSRAYSIALSGNDVYVAGEDNILFTNDPAYDPTKPPHQAIWKNRNESFFPAGFFISNGPRSTAVNGNNLYVVGESSVPNVWSQATLWTNENSTRLNDVSVASYAQSVVVNGSDVYIAGNIVDYSTTSIGVNTAIYWKNGIQNKLPNNFKYSTASYITLNGSDVYVLGYTSNQWGNFTVGTYWKNGVATRLADSTSTAYVNGIAINNNDVYICGSNESGTVYWKNGRPVVLDSKGTANSIAVVSH